MTIASIASTGSQVQQTQSTAQKKYSQDLASNIESGNLTGAQAAFSQLLQTNLNKTNSTINKDFDNLKTAFSTNDISSVKSAFATLQRDTQSSDASITAFLKPGGLSLTQQAFSGMDAYLQNSGHSSKNNQTDASSLFGNSSSKTSSSYYL